MQDFHPMREPGVGLHEALAGVRCEDESGGDWQPGGYQLPEMSRLSADAGQVRETNRTQRHREYARLDRPFKSPEHCWFRQWPP